MAGGAAGGKFEVKSCGKAHAWCGVCRPQQAKAQRKGPRPAKVYVRPCRNCGKCNDCIGLTAPEGMKVCRACRETKPLDAFEKRADTGGLRNQCRECRTANSVRADCEGCGARFWRTESHRTLCPRCRPTPPKACKQCGSEFTGSLTYRAYCSDACRTAASKAKRSAAYRTVRTQALAAYSATTEPSCVCCGETITAFLALDHVNGGGHQQRKETGGGGFYAWLKRHDYPEGFQVLCHNCNFGRQLNGGVCPHEQ